MKSQAIFLILFGCFCGFAARAPCGGNLTQPQGEFFSPHYPHTYPSNAHCTWHLTSFFWQTVSLTFTFVDLEFCCDYVRVYDGPTDQAPLLGQVPGNQGNSFNSSSRYMTVIFSSDNSWSQQGFRAEWAFIGGAPCGGNLTQSEGEFFSPNFPNNYPDNAYCTWRLQSPRRQVVSLSFKSVQLETGWDLIHVYNGLSDQDPQLGVVTGNQGNSFTSSSRDMTVVFSSDSGWTQQGFRAEWHFIDSPSCRYNYNKSLSVCSCTSDCQDNRNCCYDYNDCCSTAVPETTTPSSSGTFPLLNGTVCGGNLTQSQGEFFSPNYPRNYPNNAECTWRILSPEGQIILLNIITVRLESSFDFIYVHDGQTKDSPRLGLVTGSLRSSFNSSSRYMTVVFSSDDDGSDEGFRAEWMFIHSDTARKEAIETTPDTHPTKPSQTEADKIAQKIFSSVTCLNMTTEASLESTPETEPTLPPQTSAGQVDCLSGRMNIAISKSYIDSLGYSWRDLYLGDRSCKASTNNYDITFNFPLNSCGTWRKIHNGYIIYTNNIKVTKFLLDSISTHFLLEVSCVFRHNAIVETFYETKEIVKATISRAGWFNPTIAFYPSGNFSYPITEFPYLVNFGQELFVQVQLSEADPRLHLFIDSCVASPNHNFTAQTHDLIRNGCPRDSTLRIYMNGVKYYARFRFLALMFLRAHNRVFLKCDVLICADDDYNSRCRRGCLPRRKRSLSSTHYAEVVTLGPILLKGPEEAAATYEEEEE